MRAARWLVVMALALAGQARAVEMGEVAGTIVSAETGQPVPAASVMLVGTTIGVVVDLDGRYRLSAPAGDYTLQVQSLGFKTELREKVTVRPGLTRREDIRMGPGEDVKLPAIEVEGKYDLIQPESSTSRRIIRGDDVRSIPVDDVLEAIKLVPGVVAAGGDLHFRGGRSGEVQYQLDGIPVRDPLQTEPFSISTVALSETEVLTGGMDAEYGNAQSGIVELQTRDGGEKFAGEIRYESDDYGAPDRTYTNFDRLALGFGGPLVAQGLTFFASYEGTYDDTYLKTAEERDSRTILDFISLGDRQDSQSRWTGKVTYRLPNHRDRLSLETVQNQEDFDSYLHAWSRNGFVQTFEDIDPDGNPITRYGGWSPAQLDASYIPYDGPAHTPDHDDHVSLTKLSWGHNTEHTTIETRFAYLSSRAEESVLGKKPEEYETFFPDYWNGNFEEGFFFATHGDYPFYSSRVSEVWTLRSDIARAGEKHTVRGGLIGQFNHLHLLQLDFPNEVNSEGTQGRFRSELAIDNPEGAVYIQDQWKHEGLVLNAGLRYDFFSLGNQFDELAADERVRDQWSPRLGIAFPISDRDAMSFHYGRYFQVPDRRFIFEERNSNVRIRGNLNLEPEVTVAYQAAVQHLISQDVGITATIFFKDIFGLLTTERREVEGFVELVDVWTNQDFASARGLEISLRKRTGAPLWGELAYTLSRATGAASSAEERFENQDVETSHAAEERPLDWDQRHTVNATIHAGYPGDWIATFIASYGSGLPYTPIHLGERTRRSPEAINSARLPSTFTVDGDFSKYFGAWGQRFMLSLRGFNVLDAENIRELAPDNTPHAFVKPEDYVIYYTETGQAGGAAIDVDEAGGVRYIPLNDPRVWGRGRVIRFGVGWAF
jgi:outer membrane receptor for ferrienterochelin and colicin